MDTDKIKHLEFVQDIITRMNTNSFHIKGMAVTIAAALLAVYASTQNNNHLLCGIAPCVLFWFLDAYYLQQERKFRGIYNNLIGLKKEVEIKPFEMPLDMFSGKEYRYFRAFISKTIWLLYCSIIIGLLAMYFIVAYHSKTFILCC